MKRLAGRIVLALGSTLVTLFAVEVGVRLFFPQPPFMAGCFDREPSRDGTFRAYCTY